MNEDNFAKLLRPDSNRTQLINGELFHYGLGTYIVRLEYDWHTKRGQVWTLGPVDMSGTIHMFTSIDPRVHEIHTYVEGQPDTGYWKMDGEWKAGTIKQMA